METNTKVKSLDLRFEPIAKLRLSVEAMGRRELNISARWKAGSGEVVVVEGGVDVVAVDAMEPAEERRAMSVVGMLDGGDVWKGRKAMGMDLPLCALSLLCITRLPSSLTAALLSPRLFVNTFKQTLRGGISSISFVLLCFLCGPFVKKEKQSSTRSKGHKWYF